MRLQLRNLQTVWFSNYDSEVMITDDDGYATGEKTVSYTEPTAVRGNLSSAGGMVQTEIFGNLDGYSRVFMSDDISLNVDANSVFWVDSEPNEDLTNYDYIVKRVAKSLNSVSILLTKVDVK